MTYRHRFEGDDCAGELSGERYGVFRFRPLVLGVCTWSTMTSAKFTVFRGVVLRVALGQRLMAERVISCNWRADLLRETVREESFLEFLGVKNRVKRLGVMGGGFFSLRLPVVKAAGGGDDESISDTAFSGSLRKTDGDDIAACL